ncbi:unnamed protein product [Mytilus coruscus]|uniref:Uncharacterized protein n=1 Tax=Mytilus coruscus TaxID=42192 RepID=A0A6J8AZB3_MYTCO|nr:unnamed protein product [Mytilus coruscus]
MLYENRNHLECDANEESNIVGALHTVKDLNSSREKDHPQNADNTKKNKDTNIDSGDTVQCTRKLISVDENNTLNESSQNASQSDPEEETILKSVVSPKPSKTSKKITEDSTTSQPNDKKNGAKTPVQAGEKRKCTKSNPAIKISEKDEIIVTQKTRILNLENEIKQMKTVIDAIQAGKETSNQNQTSNENAHAREYRQQDHMAQIHIKDMLLDQRLRAIETQMMQNMCIQTAITTQIAIQAKQHPPVLPHICTGQVPVHPYQYISMPNIPTGMNRTYDAQTYMNQHYGTPMYMNQHNGAPTYMNQYYGTPEYANHYNGTPAYMNQQYRASAYTNQPYGTPTYMNQHHGMPTYMNLHYRTSNKCESTADARN